MIDQSAPDYRLAYEGVEAPQNFPSASALAEYRALVLEKTREQVDFIARQGLKDPLRVLELCSGNGRLLIELAMRGMLSYGLGVEIAESRSKFARVWADDLKLANLDLVAADALTFSEFDPGSFDLAVCITGAFNYFYSIDRSAPAQVLRTLATALRPQGAILLELYQLTAQRRRVLDESGGHLRTWEPLPEKDRFAYYLSEFRYSADDGVLDHVKTFIGRDGRIDTGRREVLKHYSVKDMEAMLGAAGLSRPDVYDDFDGTAYDPSRSARQVIWATRL